MLQENLFTNVPIDETIKIILNSVYGHSNLPPPKLPREALKKLLELCTNESTFKRKDGVAMCSQFGCIFANYYMSALENNVLTSISNKPTLYARYVDDKILLVNSEQDIRQNKELMEAQSVLKFTYEIGYDRLSFLDVNIKFDDDICQTSVHIKPSNTGDTKLLK